MNRRGRNWRKLVLAGLLLLVTCPRAAVPPLVDEAQAHGRAWDRFEDWVRKATGGIKPYGFRAMDAALAGRLSGRRLYCQLAVDLVEEQVGQAEAAMARNERPEIAGDSYLQVGPMLADLAATLDWCKEQVQPGQRRRWSAYAEQTLENLWHPDKARWGRTAHPWSGWSLDNPGNNYYYSFLEATVYWALASDSSHWMKRLEEDKWPRLAAYFRDYQGGGSREGTGYGLSHARLFEVYRLWRRAGKPAIPALDRLARDSMAYWVHATLPTMDMVAAIGDQARVSMPVMYDYHRKLMLLAHALVREGEEARYGAWWLRHITVREMHDGANFRYDLLPVGKGEKPRHRWYQAPAVGQLFLRSAWDRRALWMSVVAGIYDEEHAHQEQGGFSLFREKWLAVTENVFTHSGIQQGVDVHNVLRFRGPDGDIPQRFSINRLQLESREWGWTVQADLSAAYAHSPLVSRWVRQLDFSADRVDVTDEFVVAETVQTIWQINVPERPRRKGRDIQAGSLCIRPLEPADPEVRIIHWPDVKREYETFKAGWKLELRGTGQRYRVRLLPGGCDS